MYHQEKKLCDLPSGHATNSICYCHAPKGIFMYERVDTGYSSHYGENVQNHFYDLNSNELKVVTDIGLTENTWGGCRGKCYVNYTNGNQHIQLWDSVQKHIACLIFLLRQILEK